jgi:transcriptional regulator with XRE-family HTH domain
MSVRSQYSEAEINRISLRIKSARVLSGMNQEEFSNANGIPHMSLKGWEMGKALPRQTGLLKFIDALLSIGIQVDAEWLLCGGGAGPTFVEGARPEAPTGKSVYLDQQIMLFKKEQAAKGLNPLVVEVADSEMEPEYNKGDIIGGIFVAYDSARKRCAEKPKKGSVFLVRIKEGVFAPRQVFLKSDGGLFISSFNDPELTEYSTQLLAKVCWHYFPESQT